MRNTEHMDCAGEKSDGVMGTTEGSVAWMGVVRGPGVSWRSPPSIGAMKRLASDARTANE